MASDDVGVTPSCPVERVLAVLEARDCRPRRSGSGWEARCPAHDDRRASLSVGEGDDGRVLLRCHAADRCDIRAIAEALGLRLRELFVPSKEQQTSVNGRRHVVATYQYVDVAGNLLFEVVRYSPKGFAQRRPDGGGEWIWKLGDTRRVLYRLPRVVSAIANGETIFVVEGEKKVEALEAVGLVSTTCPMGAGKWLEEHTNMLRGASRRRYS